MKRTREPAIDIPPGLSLRSLLDAVDEHPTVITQGRSQPNRYAYAFGCLRQPVGSALLTVGDNIDGLHRGYAIAHVITMTEPEYAALLAQAVERQEAVEHARALRRAGHGRMAA